MRIATFILGLVLSVLMAIQSCLVYMTGGLADALNDDTSAGGLAAGGAIGLVVTFFVILGMAFTLGMPRVAMVFYIAAALLAFAVAPDFGDMGVYAVALIILAAMALFSRRQKRTDLAAQG